MGCASSSSSSSTTSGPLDRSPSRVKNDALQRYAVDTVQNVALFSALGAQEDNKLEVKEMIYEPQQAIVVQGEEIHQDENSGWIYVIKSGSAEVLENNVRVNIIKQGGVLGERALALRLRQRTATARCLEQCCVICISIRSLERALGLEHEQVEVEEVEAAEEQRQTLRVLKLTKEAVVGRLRDFPILSSLSQVHLNELAAQVTVRRCEPGEFILRKGEEGCEFFLLDRGRIGVLAEEKGKEGLLTSLSDDRIQAPSSSSSSSSNSRDREEMKGTGEYNYGDDDSKNSNWTTVPGTGTGINDGEDDDDNENSMSDEKEREREWAKTSGLFRAFRGRFTATPSKHVVSAILSYAEAHRRPNPSDATTTASTHHPNHTPARPPAPPYPYTNSATATKTPARTPGGPPAPLSLPLPPLPPLPASPPPAHLIKATLSAGQFFGESALLPESDGRRSASVVALTHVTLLVMGKDTFTVLMRKLECPGSPGE